MYVVMLACRFDTMEFPNLGPLPVAIRTEVEPHRYLPVFDSYEAAVAWAGGSEHVREVRDVGPAHLEVDTQ